MNNDNLEKELLSVTETLESKLRDHNFAQIINHSKCNSDTEWLTSKVYTLGSKFYRLYGLIHFSYYESANIWFIELIDFDIEEVLKSTSSKYTSLEYIEGLNSVLEILESTLNEVMPNSKISKEYSEIFHRLFVLFNVAEELRKTTNHKIYISDSSDVIIEDLQVILRLRTAFEEISSSGQFGGHNLVLLPYSSEQWQESITLIFKKHKLLDFLKTYSLRQVFADTQLSDDYDVQFDLNNIINHSLFEDVEGIKMDFYTKMKEVNPAADFNEIYYFSTSVKMPSGITYLKTFHGYYYVKDGSSMGYLSFEEFESAHNLKA